MSGREWKERTPMQTMQRCGSSVRSCPALTSASWLRTRNPAIRSGGLDAKFVLFGNLNLRGYYAKSWSPGLRGDDAAFGGRLTYANNWFNIYAGHGVTEK